MTEIDLNRFLDAQAPVYAQALAELRAGSKRSHWMWYVLPQIAGLGLSPTSMRYGVAGRAEAVAYLAHPVLGPRLYECVEAVMRHPDKSARAIFGAPDDAKFRSCLTLFEAVAEQAGRDPAPFAAALDQFYGGARDAATPPRL